MNNNKDIQLNTILLAKCILVESEPANGKSKAWEKLEGLEENYISKTPKSKS